MWRSTGPPRAYAPAPSPPQGIIFVIDSSDKLRLVVAKDELKELLAHEDVKASHCPILFYANKARREPATAAPRCSPGLCVARARSGPRPTQKDVPGALPAVEIMRMMELERISDRTWHIACVLRPGDSAHRSLRGEEAWGSPVLTRSSLDIPVASRCRESNALTGDGVDGGAYWLADNIKRTRGK